MAASNMTRKTESIFDSATNTVTYVVQDPECNVCTNNVYIRSGISEEEFIDFCDNRDATLTMPKLTLPAIQVNNRAGELPAAENNGVVYLRTPINVL